MGAAPMETWDTDAEHLAERNRLVFIIALGESILLMGGAVLAEDELTWSLGLSLLVGFASLFTLWWNYFAVAGHDQHGGRSSTAALRGAYAYAHALMVLGAILVAVSIELRLSHHELSPAVVVLSVGGPLVYLAGNLVYLRARHGGFGRSRLGAAGALVAVGAVALAAGHAVPPLVLSLAVLAVMVALGVTTARGSRAAVTAHP